MSVARTVTAILSFLCGANQNDRRKAETMKKLISVLLVLVLCFTLMSALAYADKIDRKVDKVETIVGSVGQISEKFDFSQLGTFKLPNDFTQLFSLLKHATVWTFVRDIVATIKDVKANI